MNTYIEIFKKISDLKGRKRTEAVRSLLPEKKKAWKYFIKSDPELIQKGCFDFTLLEDWDMVDFLAFRGADPDKALKDAEDDKRFCGARLYYVRNQEKFSLNDVAKKIGVSKMAVHLWEQEVNHPSDKNVDKLCEIFNVSRDYFFSTYFIYLERVEFREEYLSEIQLSNEEKREILNESDLKKAVDLKLERFFKGYNAQSKLVFKPLRQTLLSEKTEKKAFDVAERKALRLRKSIGYGTAPIANMYAFAERVGVVVIEMNLPDQLPGFQFYVEQIPFVFVSEKLSVLRKRFTIGHELAHFIFNVKSGYTDDAGRGNDKPDSKEAEEAIAHYFAAALLVPASIMFERFGAESKNITRKDLISIEKEYGISCLGLLYRLLKLRIIDWDTLHRLEKQLTDDKNMENGEDGKCHFPHESILVKCAFTESDRKHLFRK